MIDEIEGARKAVDETREAWETVSLAFREVAGTMQPHRNRADTVVAIYEAGKALITLSDKLKALERFPL